MQDETASLVNRAADKNRLLCFVVLITFDFHFLDDLLQIDVGLLINDETKAACFIVFADIGDRLIKKAVIQRWHGDKKMAG